METETFFSARKAKLITGLLIIPYLYSQLAGLSEKQVDIMFK